MIHKTTLRTEKKLWGAIKFVAAMKHKSANQFVNSILRPVVQVELGYVQNELAKLDDSPRKDDLLASCRKHLKELNG